MPHPYLSGSPRPRVLAHRGLVTAQDASDGVVENSFAAIAQAHAAGVVYVESDCHLTADGEVVLFHDDDLGRVAGDPRAVAAVSAYELESLMADRGGLATLAQTLDAFPTLRFNLDVKAPDAARRVGELVAPHADRVLITSFSDERRSVALETARARGGVPATSPGTSAAGRVVAAIASRFDPAIRRSLAGLDALQLPERRGGIRVVTRRLVDAAHRHGVEVHVWTVNDEGDMARLLDLGVDGLVTDRADAALTLVDRRG